MYLKEHWHSPGEDDSRFPSSPWWLLRSVICFVVLSASPWVVPWYEVLSHAGVTRSAARHQSICPRLYCRFKIRLVLIAQKTNKQKNSIYNSVAVAARRWPIRNARQSSWTTGKYQNWTTCTLWIFLSKQIRISWVPQVKWDLHASIYKLQAREGRTCMFLVNCSFTLSFCDSFFTEMFTSVDPDNIRMKSDTPDVMWLYLKHF